MLDIFKYIFSNFWIFVGTYILLELIVVNLFKLILNFRKCKCVERLSKDGKTSEEINDLLSSEDKNESEDK